MQIIFLSPIKMLISFIVLWPVIQVVISLLCFKINNRYYSQSAFLFKTRKWEMNGEIYNKIFKIRKWKKFLPDGAAVMKNGYKKRHLVDLSKENLEKFILESCRAEFQHWVSILPFWLFGFIAPPRIIIYMFIYAVLVNFPCIVAQRYNRPRIVKILTKIEEREQRKSLNH